MKLITVQDSWEIGTFAREVVDAVNSGLIYMHEVPDEVHGSCEWCFIFTSELRLTEAEVASIYERLACDD